MARSIAHLMSMLLVAAAIAGCSASAPSRFYTLTSAAAPDGAPAVRAAVMVGSVTIPASVDQPEIVVQAAPNRVEPEEFNRWAAPLSDGIARAVAGDLAILLGSPEVAAAAMANFNPAYTVTIDVQRFESMPGDAAILEAVWTVRKTAGGETRSGRTIAREAVKDNSFDALAAAHSRAIAKMSGDIAAAIRAEAAGAGNGAHAN